MGTENVPWRITTANQDFSICETYSQILGVPLHITDEELMGVAQFRSKGRIPVSVFNLGSSNRGGLLIEVKMRGIATLGTLIRGL